MSTEYRKARPEEFEDLLDFGNMVFGIDFRALLPKLYGDHPELAECHYLALEDGKIKAMIGCFPWTMKVGNHELKVKGIGTVSVHPYSRGKGYMKKLMQMAVEDARKEGTDLMCLGGQRQRYEYFGFVNAVSSCGFRVTPTNRRHHKEVKTDHYSVVSLLEHPEYTADCMRLFNGQLIHAVRAEKDFPEICQSWSSEPLVLLRDGKFAGYASVDKNGEAVREFLLEKDVPVLEAVFALVDKKGRELSFTPDYWQKEMVRAFAGMAESCSVSNGEMIQVLDYSHVLEAFLQCKADSCGILDGSLVLEVEEQGKYRIAVENGQVSVKDTEEKAAYSLTHVPMQTRLFSVANLWQYDTLEENSWFPLAVPLASPDMV